MKLYNPFRWHVARLHSGQYIVRRLTKFGWSCMDRDGICTWSSPERVVKYCQTSDVQRAIDLCASVRLDLTQRVWP